MDDLLDLSWSEQPAKKPPALGGSSFDLLSRPKGQGNYYSGASTPLAPSKPASNAGSSANLAGMRVTPTLRSTASPRPGVGRAASPAQPGAADAFSDLLGMSGAGGGKNLSMAEKQAQLAAQKAKEAEEEKNRWGDGAFWDQLGGSKPAAQVQGIAAPTPAKAKVPLGPALQPASSGSRPSSAAKKSAGSFWDTDSLLGQPEPAKPKASSKSPSPPAKDAGSLWTDDDLLNGLSAKPAAKSSQKGEISWDDDEVLLGGSSSSSNLNKPAAAAAAADPWDFDALSSSVPQASAGRDNDDDDLLGELGRPARKTSVSASYTHARPQSHGPSHTALPMLTAAPCRATGLVTPDLTRFAPRFAPERTRQLAAAARHRADCRDGLPT